MSGLLGDENQHADRIMSAVGRPATIDHGYPEETKRNSPNTIMFGL